MAGYMNRTTLKATIRNALANYIEWSTSKGFQSIDAAADQIVALLPGEIPKDIGKVIVSAIHLGVKLNYPIAKLGELIAKKIREGGGREEKYSGINNDVGSEKQVKVSNSKYSDTNSRNEFKEEKDGEDIMAKKINKKKSVNSNGGGGTRSRRGPNTSLNPYEEKNAKEWGRDGSAYKKRWSVFGSNDLKWVSNYPELLNGLIGPNFFRKRGTSEVPLTRNAPTQTIGSVASIELILSTGQTKGRGYALAVDKLFSSLRSANTGSLVYNKIDLQHYMWNARMVLALLRYGRRAYGILRSYSLLDSTKPISYFKAMGLDYDTFSANAANFRQYLNYTSTRLHTLLPYKDDTMERTCWLFDHIFADSDDAKAQEYLFCLNAGNFVYYDMGNSAWAKLSNITGYSNNANNTGTSYSSFTQLLDRLIDSFAGSNVFGAIAADMLKCFGVETIQYYSLIDENYTVAPIYNEEVLTEIQNATLIGEVVPSSTAAQSSDLLLSEASGYIVCDVVNTNETSEIPYLRLDHNYMNTYKDQVNNAEVVTFTRLQACGYPDAGYTNKIDWDCFGTEIATVIRFIRYEPSSGFKHNLTAYVASKFMSLNTTNANSIAYDMHIMSLWSQFDWAPLIGYTLCRYGNATTPSLAKDLGYLWDFNNYAEVTVDELNSYHDIAVMSQYNAPLFIKDTRDRKSVV